MNTQKRNTAPAPTNATPKAATTPRRKAAPTQKAAPSALAPTTCAPGLTVGASTIDGLGCFATRSFRKRSKIAEYVGDRISRREIKRRLQGRQRIHICGINSYWAIDGLETGNGTQYINHSCAPNCYSRVIGERIFFFAKRDIAPGEEILLDYEISWHDDDYGCRCGAATCRGTINERR